ncbi:hypothetical protein FCZ13_20685 [Escherichia coli]|nr:hypothetical protein [Escherichia coli]
MSAEQDAGKSGKKLAALLGLSSIILFGGSYIAFSKVSGSNSDMQSAVNINSAASGGTRSVTETPHYRELLRADNERGAAAAARNNQTFIASLPQGLDIPDTPEKQQQPAAKPENYAYRQASGTPQEDRAASEKRMERLQKLIVRIKDQHPAGSTPTIATTMWNKSPAETTGQNGTQQFALQNASLSTPVAEKGIQLIPDLHPSTVVALNRRSLQEVFSNDKFRVRRGREALSALMQNRLAVEDKFRSFRPADFADVFRRYPPSGRSPLREKMNGIALILTPDSFIKKEYVD